MCAVSPLSFMQNYVRRDMHNLNQTVSHIRRRIDHGPEDLRAVLLRQMHMPMHFISLCGRIGDIKGLLQQPDTRMVFLVGMGGIGEASCDLVAHPRLYFLMCIFYLSSLFTI